MPKFCKYCGAALQVDDKFCGSCGSRIAVEKSMPVQAEEPEIEAVAEAELVTEAEASSAASKEVQKMADAIAAEICSFQNGNQEAFSRLYELSKNYVYYTILKNQVPESAVDDIMQEVYLSIYNGAAGIQKPQAAMAWIRQVSFHKAMDYFRKNKMERPVSNSGSGNSEQSGSSMEGSLESVGLENLDQEVEDTRFPIPETLFDDKETQRLLRETIENLAEDQKRIILAFYYNGCSISEIAELFEMPEGTVKTNLYRARTKIKNSIETMEKTQGIRLHTAALAPALLFLFHTEAQAAEVPAATSMVVQKIMQTGISAAAQNATAAGSRAVQQNVTAAGNQTVQQNAGNMQAQSISQQSTFQQNVPGQNTFQQTMPDQNMMQQNTFQQNIPGQNIPGQNMPQQNTFQQTMPDQNMMQQAGPQQWGVQNMAQNAAGTAAKRGIASFTGKKLAAGIVAVSLAGGAGAGYYVYTRSTPEKTIQEFEDAYNAKDMEAMIECMDSQTQQAYESMKALTQLFGADPQDVLDGVLGLGDYLEVLDEEDLKVEIEVKSVEYVSDDHAVANVVIIMAGEQGEDTMDLIREDHTWHLNGSGEDFGM